MELLIQSYNKKIQDNEDTTYQCKKNIHDYEVLRCNLQTYQKELSPQIMVPLGSKALMRGKLVHTNEVLIHIGDGYLIKNSAFQAEQICNRRIKSAEVLLGELEKERSWLENTLGLQTQGLFADSENIDIQEEYNEEVEMEWRKKHRESVRNYHQQTAKNKNELNAINDEEYWERLEMLELQEELEADLEGLSAEDLNKAKYRLNHLKDETDHCIDNKNVEDNRNIKEDHLKEEKDNYMDNKNLKDDQNIKEENLSKEDLRDNRNSDFVTPSDKSALLTSYKNHLKELESQLNKHNVKDDNDLLSKLDLYEKMEEIQERISLLEDDDTETDESYKKNEDTDNTTMSDQSDKENENALDEESASLSKKTKRVMFAEKNSVKIIDSEEPAEPLRIEFLHSSENPIYQSSDKKHPSDIETPYDIYSVFKNCFEYNKTPSSILKNKELVNNENHIITPNSEEEEVHRKIKPSSVIIGDVIENKLPEQIHIESKAVVNSETQPAKPMSRFKAMRQGKQ